MLGDKYIVKESCFVDECIKLNKGDILTEKEGYNFETEQREDCPDGYNELIHDTYGYICDVGSNFAVKNLIKFTSPCDYIDI